MKQTPDEQDGRNDLFKTVTIIESVTSVTNNLIKFGALCFMAYCGTNAITSLAGQETIAQLSLAITTKLNANQQFAYIFGLLGGGGGITYGLMQRKLKGDIIKRFEQRKEYLERQLDPGRKSSELTTRGETRPEDKP